jgi:hypothetical protein
MEYNVIWDLFRSGYINTMLLTFLNFSNQNTPVMSRRIFHIKIAMGIGLYPITSAFPCQDLLTSAPYVFIIYCQHYIILAIDSIIKKHKVKLVLLDIFQEIECCEWGSCNISVNVVRTTYPLPRVSYVLYLCDVRIDSCS